MYELTKITAGIWAVQRPLVLAGAQIGCRMAVVRLPKGKLLLHSPVQVDRAWPKEVAELGDVKWIVAPSLMHTLWTADAKTIFPEAQVLAPPGFGNLRPNLEHAPLLESEEIARHFDMECIGGMPKVNEVAMCHRKSGTLLAPDLVFNIPADTGFFTRLMFRLNGGFGKVTQTRIFKSHVKDRAAHMESIEKIFDWDFDRIVLAHGHVVNEGGKEALKDVYRTR